MSRRTTAAPDSSRAPLNRRQRRSQNERPSASAKGRVFGEPRRKHDPLAHLDPQRRALIDEALAIAAKKLEAGVLHEALHLADEVLKRVADHPVALSIKGSIAFFRCEYFSAVELYEKSIAGDDRLAQVHFNLGIAYQNLFRHGDAARSFAKVTAMDPRFPNCWTALGIALLGQWRFEEAIESTEKGLAYAGDRAETYATLGGACLGLGRVEEALFHFAAALKRKPNVTHLQGPMNMAATVLANTPGAVGEERWEAILPALRKAMPGSPVPALIESFIETRRPDPPLDALARTAAALPPAGPLCPQVGGTLARICILLNFGRSGTGLIHALLNGHPEITTLPGVYLKGFFGPTVWEQIRDDHAAVMIDRFIGMYAVLFDARDPTPVPGNPTSTENGIGIQEGFAHMGDNQTQYLTLDRGAFRGAMLKLLAGRKDVSQGEFFLAVHHAFARAEGSFRDEDLIFYHIHNPSAYEFANFQRFFPDAQILMMVREPVQSCESWNAKDVLNLGNYVGLTTRTGTMPFQVNRLEFCGRDAFGLRLEDLKRKPEATMRALAKRLAIGWDPCLLEPTMQGLKWQGDPTSKTFGLPPFDTGVIERKVGEIFGERDQLILRTLYYPFRVLYGYQEADDSAFRADLATIKPMLDAPMECEKLLVERAALPMERLETHTLYRYLRVVLRSRLETLKKYGTYPGMIQPLRVDP